ncbi:MAG: iron-sulfur cluster insertion protein ErpA [Magnetospiraceae bacterium]
MNIAVQDQQKIAITESAAKRIGMLISMEGKPDLRFRISITGGGCSGFSYNFSLDAAAEDDDLVFEQHGVAVVIDPMSLELVDGAEIDYVEDLVASSFRVNNPNASSSCGCGSSFSV